MANFSVTTGAKHPYKLTFIRILNSEWVKLFSLRSTWWISSLAIVLNIVVCTLFGLLMKFSESMYSNPDLTVTQNGQPVAIEPGSLGLLSSSVVGGCEFIGQLVFIILAIMIVTNEYSSGMIRSTFTVAPRRSRVLTAKMIVISVVCVIVFAISVTASWAIDYAILKNTISFDLTLTSAASMRILLGFILEMMLISLFCFGLGAIIRSTAGSIGAAVGIVFVLPMIQGVIGSFTGGGNLSGWRKWLVDVLAFLPTSAGDVITEDPIPDSSILNAWQGMAVLAAWTLVSIVIALITTARRDA